MIFNYRMTYLKQEKILPNFGAVPPRTVPFVVHRTYEEEMDDYVLNKLSNPKACIVEKAVYENVDDVDTAKWEVIYFDDPVAWQKHEREDRKLSTDE